MRVTLYTSQPHKQYDKLNRRIHRAQIVEGVPENVICTCGASCVLDFTMVMSRVLRTKLKSMWHCPKCVAKVSIINTGVWK